ncbi:MAG: hypothetical protein P4L79_10355 [Legionella sp.]|uniref:hypothetical protein n=1 Tax=Legionella sp. TaxID=459 RepID=UPI002841399F|nr:hypothetical protein [Legionella sp.]
MNAPHDFEAVTGISNKAVIKKGDPIKCSHKFHSDGSVSTFVLSFDRKTGLVRRANVNHDSRSEMNKTFGD